jgi:hypothetical protein
MTEVSLAPVVTIIGQYLIAIIAAILTAAIPILATQLSRYLGLKYSDAQWAVFKRTADAAAQQIWARETASLATAQINVSNPLVAGAVNAAIAQIPSAVSALGLSPDDARAAMAKGIQAHLGGMQSVAASAPARAGAK